MFHDFLSAILGNWNGSQAHEKRKDRAKILNSEKQEVKGNRG